MSLSKIKELLSLNEEDLSNEILKAKQQLFELRLKQGTKQSFSSHSFRHLKHRLGQLLMIQGQKTSATKKKTKKVCQN